MKRELREIIRLQRRFAYRINGFLGRFENPLWLIGSARSGTTWLSNLINHHGEFREMFEPFHPVESGPRTSIIQPFQYIRPDVQSHELYPLANDIFSGRFSHQRVDRTNRRVIYRGMVIKDIFANLFACWAVRQFNLKRVVLLIRNPFSVALSKQRLHRYFHYTDTLSFLDQKKLIEDHLLPYREIIERVRFWDNFILNQILIWSVIHTVPLKQFHIDQLHVVYYEDLYLNPIKELVNTYRILLPEESTPELDSESILVKSPSRYSFREKKDLSQENQLNKWKSELTKDQIDRGLMILDAFGLNSMYGTGNKPNRKVAATLLSE